MTKTTIYDIARLSGASPSTVSAVLNGTWRKRRIRDATVAAIQKIAAEHGYTLNRQARGLRQARSGMVGMIIPLHDNRFFSSLSQTFDTFVRARGLCPVIASTLRDPDEERRIVSTLISYAVDSIFIAGATDAGPLSDLCAAAGVPHVFVDLPGRNAPSVVSDNYRGAEMLTGQILAHMPRLSDLRRARPCFIGGSERDYATQRRMEAFRAVCAAQGIEISDDDVQPCGYAPATARAALRDIYQRRGGLPAGLFVNSLTVFEGVLAQFTELKAEEPAAIQIGCYDYDPFAAFLHFPVYMVRQNSDALIARAYDILESGETAPVMIEVEPDLIEPRTVFQNAPMNLG